MLGEDAVPQLRCRLVRAAFGAGQCRLGRHQAALDGRLKNRCPIPFQIPLHAFERQLGLVEAREQRFDCVDDSSLF